MVPGDLIGKIGNGSGAQDRLEVDQGISADYPQGNLRQK
jgi:hypothetical protein